MRHLRWVGLLFSLLIVGVLGGLMAPVPSEAAQASGTTAPSYVSVTFQVDSGTAVNILGNLAACSSGDLAAGFNWCYELARGTISSVAVPNSATGTASNKTRKFTIVPFTAGSNEPRLLIADFKNQNTAQITGFKVVPLVNASGYNGTTLLGSSWTTSEAHKVTINYQVKFDSFGNYAGCSGACTSNIDDAGAFYSGFGGGGQYQPNPSCGLSSCTNYVNSDRTDLSQKGDFIPAVSGVTAGRLDIVIYDSSQDNVPTDSAQSSKPHFWAESTNSFSGVQYSKYDHETNYPNTGDCRVSIDPSNADYAKCVPTLKFTHIYSFWGPDQLNVDGSDLTVMLKTDLCFKPQGPPTNNPNNPCKNRSGKKTTNTQEALAAILVPFAETEIQNNSNQGFPLGIECTVNDPACRCAGPQCTASYIHVVRATPDSSGNNQTFTFSGTGPGMGDGVTPFAYPITVQTVTLPDMTTDTFGKFEWNNLPSFGGFWHIEVGPYPVHPQSGKRWDMDNLGCTSAKYETLLTKTTDFTDWTEPSGSVKTGHDVLRLQGGDVLTCVWHIHTTAQ